MFPSDSIFSSTEFVKTLQTCHRFTSSHILSSFSWDTRPPSKIISLEIWASFLIRKNSLTVYKFCSLGTSASCSNLGTVPYFILAPALKLLFQKKKSVLINSYIYTIHNSSSSSWQTICEQVQNFCSSEPGSFFVNIFSSWQCKFQNKARETSSTLYGGFWDIPCPTTENVHEKWPWHLW